MAYIVYEHLKWVTISDTANCATKTLFISLQIFGDFI